jgi:bifunctional oligoribonuclease and PAP phosphatase NrnA
MQQLSLLYPQLLQPKKVVITTHQKPDGDAMGSALALYHFLKESGHDAVVVSPTNWADFLNWMPGCNTVIDFDRYREKAIKLINAAEIIFCLDFNVLHRIKNLAPFIENASCIKVLIDHHQQPQEDEFDFGASDTAKSSTCEMVYDFIIASPDGDKINNDIAVCLYTGVMTDTGSFRFPGTTASVHAMVADLKRRTNFEHTIIHENIYDNFLEERLRFIGHALLHRLEVFYEENTALMVIPKSDLMKFHIKTGDTEGLVNYLLSIEGIKFGALVIDRDEERKWSFRSKGGFDVNTFARLHFEGGGHKNAAGGRSSESLDANVKFFKQVLKQYKEQLQ